MSFLCQEAIKRDIFGNGERQELLALILDSELRLPCQGGEGKNENIY